MNKTVLALAALLFAIAGPAQADDVADFYKGKTVRIVVGVGVGSGYDINARALARYLGTHIPGNPTVIVQNQPGAGSLTMTNTLYGTGPVRRHRHRRLLQRAADHAALAARAACISRRPSSTGSAAPIASRRRCMSGTPRRSRRSTISTARR